MYSLMTIEFLETLYNFGFNCICDGDKKEVRLEIVNKLRGE